MPVLSSEAILTAIMMPTAIADVDGALHGQAVELECGEEQMQQAGVVGIIQRSRRTVSSCCACIGYSSRGVGQDDKRQALDVLRRCAPSQSRSGATCTEKVANTRPIEHLGAQAVPMMLKVEVRR